MADRIEQLVPSFRIRINGADLQPEVKSDLVSAVVQEDVDAPGMFALQLIIWDMARLKFNWVDDDLFAPGNEVEVEMGYVDHLDTLIKGEITALEPEFCIVDIPKLTVRGYDRRHRLMRGSHTRSFVQMKDSDIARQIAGDAKLSAQVKDTGVTLDYILQHNQTDLDFLQDRAARIGYEVVVEDKSLHFRPCRNADSNVLTLRRETDLLEFYPRLTTLDQVGEVAVRGWDPVEKQAVVGQAAAGSENTKMGGKTSGPEASVKAFGKSAAASVDRPVFNQAEADQMALGQLNRMALAYVSGEGICMGRNDLRAGTVIDLLGMGQRFSGHYYVTSTTHSYLPDQGYRTAFSVRRNST